jgi:hypothetical protein
MNISSSTIVRQKYRELARLIQLLPEKKYPPEKSWEELRHSFRAPLAVTESAECRVTRAEQRLAFLRMITPKTRQSGEGGRWLYKNGKRVEGGATTRDSNGKVVSNWDGKNLDPDNVKRHNHHLKRLGFRNNAHAKGIF